MTDDAPAEGLTEVLARRFLTTDESRPAMRAPRRDRHNKEWASTETVRGEWPTGFPQGIRA